MEEKVNKKIHVGFVGRLEKEKGIDILLQTIEALEHIPQLRETIIFHIIGDGSFLKILKKSKGNVHIYGKLSQNEVLSRMKEWDILCMPSRFLETFGLVALESLSMGIPVCGPRIGGLKEFIPEELEIDMSTPVESLVRIFARIIDDSTMPTPDITAYSYENWKIQLEKIIDGRKNILIIHDYIGNIGGAESYIEFLRNELQSMSIHVNRYGLPGYPSRLIRIWNSTIAPIAFWRYFTLRNLINRTNPDFIWMQSIVRYMTMVSTSSKKSGKSTIVTHHDLGLITARPSSIHDESHIPHTLSLHEFLNGSTNPIEFILRIFKYISVASIWDSLSHIEAHIVPSHFMQKPFEDISGNRVIVFPHTLIKARTSTFTSKENE